MQPDPLQCGKIPEAHALPQADQARTDFASIESELEIIQKQLALPTRRELAGTALGIIFATAALVILWDEAAWHL